MEKVSVAIITKEEEKNIRACLESVQWADEIIVIDAGSQDKTKQICAEYGAKVFVEEWQGFGRQKNKAIEKTKNEWVLNLDADERVTPELAAEIAETLDGKLELDGFYIPRKNFFGSRWIRHGGWYPDYNLRLFRKSKGRFQERQVHEKVILEGKVGYLKNPLEHRTYNSIKEFLQRQELYSDLAAQEMLNEGKKYRFYDILFRPSWTFLQMYILRAGFLDGYYGFLLARLYSYYTFVKYSKLKELMREDAFPFAG
ncbi:MAG: glycosyltransferase family 2 protein [Thermodesulfobacteriota bacterium]